MLGIGAETFRGTFPFTPRYREVNGFRMHYVDEGRGEPIVLMHGDPTWGYLYRYFIPPFSSNMRCIVPDCIGMGKSESPADVGPLRLRDHVSNLESLLLSLDLRELTLMLHDWGGPVGLGYAIRHPDRIKRLILMNTWAFARWPGDTLPRLLTLIRSKRGEKFVLEKNGYLETVISDIAQTSRGNPESLKEAYHAPFPTPDSRRPLLWWTRDISVDEGDSSFEEFHRIENSLTSFREVPILLLWGMKDQVVPPSVLLRWQNIYPGAETHMLADAGHFLQEDAPYELIELVSRFIDKHP